MALVGPTKSRFLPQVAYLSSLKPVRQRVVLDNRYMIPGVTDVKVLQTDFEIAQPYAKVHEDLKKALKSKATHAFSNDQRKPTTSGYMLGSFSKKGFVLVEGYRQSDSVSCIYVREYVSLNILDRMQIWLGRYGNQTEE